MKRVLRLSLAVAFIVGCQDLGVQPPAGDFSAIIVDGHFNSGNGAFFWLPPSVPDDASGFGTFDPNVLPTIEICPLKDDASGPGGRVCKTDGEDGPRIVEARFTPSEIDGASNHYHVKFSTKGVQKGLYRIIASIGSTAEGDIVLAELGIRDVGIGKNVACSTDPVDAVLCISGEHQIKFRIDQDAICFDGPTLPDTCAGGTLTPDGQSFVLISGGGVQGATQSGKQLSLVFNEVNCEPVGGRVIGLEVSSVFHPMQWALYAPCFNVTTSPVITNENIEDLLEGGLLAYEICFDEPAGMSDAQQGRARLARMATDRKELQILASDPVQVVDECPDAFAAGLGAKLWKFARGIFHKVGGPFAPEPVYAARGFFRRGDFGVGGRGLKSFVGVVMPGVLSIPTGTSLDLGAFSPGASIPIEVLAKDAGGPLAEDLPELIEDNDVTFTAADGDTFNGATQTTVRTPASGSAAGNWVLANDAAGIRTLTASCFPCGGTGAPITGENLGDGFLAFDTLAFLSTATEPGNNQTITFTATVLDLTITPANLRPLTTDDFNVEVCIGSDIPALTIEFVGRANNGTPTDLTISNADGGFDNPLIVNNPPADPPVVVTTTLVGFEPGGLGCMDLLFNIDKSGGVRIVGTLLDTGEVIEVEESIKINVRPAKKN